MNQEAIFILSVLVMGTVAFVITAVVETLLLKRLEWVEQSSIWKYVSIANFVGLVASFLMFLSLIGAFLMFFGAAMGGDGTFIVMAILLAFVALFGAPLMIFVVRQLIRGVCGITKEQLTWRYSLGATLIDFFFVIVVVFVIFGAITGLSNLT